MFAIDEEKLPPPKPAVAAHSARPHIRVRCLARPSQPLGTTSASRTTGMSSRLALVVVHARPPNLGTANVYGIRSVEPTRFGSAMSRNCSDSDSVKPALARLMTMIVHSTQIEKPRFSAKIERARFLRATRLPRVSQKV